MAELDVEALKRLNEAWKNGKRYYGIGNVADQLDAIIAALEGRDRLRAAAAAAVEWWFYSEESGQGDRDTYGFDKPMVALRAALEGRDG